MVVAPQADVVVAVLTRAPSAGGKSRLFASLGIPADPMLPGALLLDTLDAVVRARVRCVVAVDPASACDEVRALVPPGVTVIAQEAGTLGERMRGVMATLLAAGAPAVAIVGSDLPEISPAAIAEALAIARADPRALVLGPALDGGYYLIAAARVPDVFDAVDWGTPTVLAQTRMRARRAGFDVHQVDAAGDIDTAGDLLRLLRTPRLLSTRTAAWARRHGLGATTDH